MTDSVSPARRLLLQSLALSPLLGADVAASPANGAALFAPFQRFDGGRGLARIEADLQLGPTCTLPARAHDLVPTPSGQQLLVMERRPGRRAWVVDIADCTIRARFEAGPGRHFEGHAAFTPDGLVLTTENDYENGRGVIGVRDASNWQTLGEFASHGIGPHEMLMLADGKTLAIANGGILTHPDKPGRNLNLDSMRSTLSYVDLASGQLLGEWTAPDPQLSIRHMDATEHGEIVLAMQFEGAPRLAMPPLLARHHADDAQLRLPDTDSEVWRALAGYIGSVRIAPDQALACATSPRGGSFVLWDLTTNGLQPPTPMADVCGVAFKPDGELLVSSGTGQVRDLADGGTETAGELTVARLHWDNHMRYLQGPAQG